MKKTLIMAAAVVASATAFAAPTPTTKVISTQELVTLCKDKASPQSQSYCGGFGQGVYDSYLVTRTKNAPSKICIPQGAKNDKVVQEFIDWTEVNPKYNSAPAAEAVLRFLGGRHPCGK